MDEKTDMQDWQSKEFQEGYDAWCDMQGPAKNPYEKNSFDWVEWNQGWHEAHGLRYED